MKSALAIIGLLLTSPPALAQDIQPVFDLPELARGQVVSSMAKNSADRGSVRRSRGPTAQQTAACASQSRFRAQLGANHPKVQQLGRLCRSVGL